MNIGQLINKRRLELNLTLEEVGKAVGVSKSTVKKWEDGFISNMKRDKIAKLAKVLSINPVSLITGEMILSTTDHTEEMKADLKQEQLLRNFQQLNTVGREKLLEYSDDLLNSGKYSELPEAKKRA